MCRLLARLGDEATLESLLYAPEFSLERQSWQPRRQIWGTINGDGWGVGWYDPARPEPARYRTTQPMWSDRNFRNLSGVIRTRLALASVRSATPGSPTEETGTAPYTWGRWLFAHNGRVLGWQDGVKTALRRELDDRWLGIVEGAADSEVLFALVLQLIEDGGASPQQALVGVTEAVRSHQDGRLNFILSDGERLYATRWGEEILVTRRVPDSTYVASEPFDDETGWDEVPDKGVVTVEPDGSLESADMGDIGGAP
jgi:glutamine amidotransferase